MVAVDLCVDANLILRSENAARLVEIDGLRGRTAGGEDEQYGSQALHAPRVSPPWRAASRPHAPGILPGAGSRRAGCPAETGGTPVLLFRMSPLPRRAAPHPSCCSAIAASSGPESCSEKSRRCSPAIDRTAHP